MASYNDWVSQMQGWGQLGSGTYPFPNGVNQQPLAPITAGFPAIAQPVASPMVSGVPANPAVTNWGLSWDATDAAGVSSPAVAAAPSGWLQSMRDSGFLGDRNNQGWGGLALGAAQGAAGLFLGLQQYNLAKETLANNKAQFERNFAAQRSTINANMEDRQRARIASNANAYQSVGDYMAQNGVR